MLDWLSFVTIALGLAAAGVPGSTPVAERRAPSPPPQIANATVCESSAEVGRRYGRHLEEQAPAIRLQGCMDVAWKDGLIYVISRDRLSVFRPGPGAILTAIGRLEGLGSTRQIEIAGRLAGVTSREDGFWLIDVGNPAKPALLSHYDTIELATGVAMSDHVALVACRQYGIEQIDISDPRRPRHLSTFRTGEAQSVFLSQHLAYVGDWGTRELVVCDVRNPWRPAPVSHFPLDGFGDGVFVRGNVCFAATGHHSRRMRERLPSDPAYGLGHGLEIIDVSNPQQPKLISRAKLPRLYRQSYDMWDVQVSGNMAVVGDTFNGIYVFDIRDLAHPLPVGHHRLPVDDQEQLPGAVGGFAIGQDCLYVAGAHTGLHTLGLPGIRPIAPANERLDVPASRPEAELKPPARVAYRPEGQVHDVAVAPATGDVWIAAGSAGLHRLPLGAGQPGQPVAATKGIVFSVDCQDGLVAAGEGLAGLSLWRPTARGVELLGRYQSPAGGIGQVCVAPDKRYVVAHAGSNVLELLDIRSPKEPKRVLDDRHVGLFYRTPFSHGFLPDGRFAVLWHATGMYVFTLNGEQGPRYAGWTVPRGVVSFAGGMAALGDRFLVTSHDGYVLLDDGQTTITPDRDLVRVAGHRLEGKPSVFGTTLYVAQRWKGTISAVDIASPRQPKLRWSLAIEGNPGPVEELAGKAVIPAGYDGVIVRPVEADRSTRQEQLKKREMRRGRAVGK